MKRRMMMNTENKGNRAHMFIAWLLTAVLVCTMVPAPLPAYAEEGAAGTGSSAMDTTGTGLLMPMSEGGDHRTETTDPDRPPTNGGNGSSEGGVPENDDGSDNESGAPTDDDGSDKDSGVPEPEMPEDVTLKPQGGTSDEDTADDTAGDGQLAAMSDDITTYAALQTACSAAGTGEVTLGANISGTTQLTIGRNLTLDLNGRTLSINLPDTAAGGRANNGISISSGVTLTIKDSSSPSTGALTVLNRASTGTTAGNGAAINTTDAMFIIQGGTVTATGGYYGAGIGGGRSGATGTIAISGGTVTATGGTEAAGIGGGYWGRGTDDTITISGGTVTAAGGIEAAGIGGGYNGTVTTIVINGGTVTATGGTDGAGIGSENGTVTISGGTVTAQGTRGGAGIGGRYYRSGGTISITGGEITAIAGNLANATPAIGSGAYIPSSYTNVTIDGFYDYWVNTITSEPATQTGTDWFTYSAVYRYIRLVPAPLTEYALLQLEFADADGDDTIVLTEDLSGPSQLTIGRDLTLDLAGHTLEIELPDFNPGGRSSNGIKVSSGMTLTIIDSSTLETGKLNVTNRASESTTNGNGAAINTTGATLVMQSGTVTAIGGSGGAGIGGGRWDDGGTIIITGGMVTATGGVDGTGIGGGYWGDSGAISITGGVITAIAGWGGSAIGRGSNGSAVVNVDILGLYDYWISATATAPTTQTGTGWFPYDSSYRYIRLEPSSAPPTDYELLQLECAISSGIDTVTLDKDISGDTLLMVRRDLTLDLSGHELTIDLPDSIPGGRSSNGIKISRGVTLTITDSSNPSTGALNVANQSTSSESGNGAAINTTGATLVIEGGAITAIGGSSAAGIGGGSADVSTPNNSISTGGTVEIRGGEVNAAGGTAGAGIGGGSYGGGGTVTISGGTVNATAGSSAAGIGGAYRSNAGTITILGGDVTAIGGNRAAHVGDGAPGSGTDSGTGFNIAMHPEAQREAISESNVAEFNVTAVASGEAMLSYQWEVLPAGGVAWEELPGNTARTLNITSLDISHSGNQYRCKVSTPNILWASRPALLTVTLRPGYAIGFSPGAVGTYVFQGKEEVVFAIENIGMEPLEGIVVALEQGNDAPFEVVEQSGGNRLDPLVGQISVAIRPNVNWAVIKTYTGSLVVTSDSGFSSTLNLIYTPTADDLEAVVTIAPAFGEAFLFKSTNAQRFTITNVGKNTITGLDAVLETGTAYRISTALSAASVAPGKSVTVSVQPNAGLTLTSPGLYDKLKIECDADARIEIPLQFAVPLSDSHFRVATAKSDGVIYVSASDVLAITEDGDYTIAMTTAGHTTTRDRIVVLSGVTANIVLDGVRINRNVKNQSGSAVCAFDTTGATVNLTLVGTNTLRSGEDSAGLQTSIDSALTITAASTGSLTANGGIDAAGVGGGLDTKFGKIIVNGGMVTATGGAGGAGIGGGFDFGSHYGLGGSIEINGGTVVARGASSTRGSREAQGGAGIGSGGAWEESGGGAVDITITGGNVTATGGQLAAGIGGGTADSYVSRIGISGGTVTAKGGTGKVRVQIWHESWDFPRYSNINLGGAGIGSGFNAWVGEISISGGTINATGGTSAAGIGLGFAGSGGSVRITGGDITAIGVGSDSTGIGSGYNSGNISVEIDGGNVVRARGDFGASVANKSYGFNITRHPASQTANEGSSAVFSISTESTPWSDLADYIGDRVYDEVILSYQWQVRVNGGITWVDIPMGISSSLNLKDIDISQNRSNYRCLVSVSNMGADSVKWFSNPAMLTVRPVPTYTVSISPSHAKLANTSDEAEFTLSTLPAGTVPNKVDWVWGGSTIADGVEGDITIDAPGPDSRTATVKATAQGIEKPQTVQIKAVCDDVVVATATVEILPGGIVNDPSADPAVITTAKVLENKVALNKAKTEPALLPVLITRQTPGNIGIRSMSADGNGGDGSGTKLQPLATGSGIVATVELRVKADSKAADWTVPLTTFTATAGEDARYIEIRPDEANLGDVKTVRSVMVAILPSQYDPNTASASDWVEAGTIDITVTERFPKVTLRAGELNANFPERLAPLTATSNDGSRVTVLSLAPTAAGRLTLEPSAPYDEQFLKLDPVQTAAATIRTTATVQVEGYRTMPSTPSLSVKVIKTMPRLALTPNSIRLFNESAPVTLTLGSGDRKVPFIAGYEVEYVYLSGKNDKGADVPGSLPAFERDADNKLPYAHVDGDAFGSITLTPQAAATADNLTGIAWIGVKLNDCETPVILRLNIAMADPNSIVPSSPVKSVTLNANYAAVNLVYATIPINLGGVTNRIETSWDIMSVDFRGRRYQGRLLGDVTYVRSYGNMIELSINSLTAYYDLIDEDDPWRGTYRLNIGSENILGKNGKPRTFAVNLVITGKEASVSVTSKGRIDIANPNSEIANTLRLRNVTGEVASVRLLEQEFEIFEGKRLLSAGRGNESRDFEVTSLNGNRFTVGLKHGAVAPRVRQNLSVEVTLTNGLKVRSWGYKERRVVRYRWFVGTDRPLSITPVQTIGRAWQSARAVTLYKDAPFGGAPIGFDLTTPANVSLGAVRIQPTSVRNFQDGGFELLQNGPNDWTLGFKDGKVPVLVDRNGNPTMTRATNSRPSIRTPLKSSYTVKIELWAEGTYRLADDGKGTLVPVGIGSGRNVTKPRVVNVRVNIR
ncbi:MAG: hypothetical protein FWH32_01175 [Clostridiales bacterium]|nr:hypothetical protein [Clostridiales bacterium]